MVSEQCFSHIFLYIHTHTHQCKNKVATDNILLVTLMLVISGNTLHPRVSHTVDSMDSATAEHQILSSAVS